MAAMTKGVKQTIVVVLLFMTLLLALLVNKVLSPRIFSGSELRANGAVVLKQPRHFTMQGLIDQDNQVFDHTRFKDRWSMVFFGYTYCPDICPTTLATLKRLNGMIEGERFSEDLQVVLMSVDPARDKPDILDAYLNYFDPGFIGVTGEFLDVHKTASALNAAFTKRMIGSDGDYLVDHSGNIAIINPRGDYHGFILPPFDAGKLRLLYRSIRADYEYRYQ
jgi:protein SCO1/2